MTNNLDGYYVCTMDGGPPIPLAGPYTYPRQAVDVIYCQPDVTKFCTYSRYMLAKEKYYPRGKAGDAKLLADMAANKHLLVAETEAK